MISYYNELSLNDAKTEFLLIGSHHKLNNLDSQPSVNIGHDSIKQVQHSTVLGVEIDENLSWNKHIENVVKNVTSGIGAMRRIRDFVDRETLSSMALCNVSFETRSANLICCV
jgi:hypothetical protein